MAKKIEELNAWKKARQLTQEVYLVSKEGKISKDFGFCNQFQRASVSVMSNIAEGYGYSNDKQFNRFLSISRASCHEVISLLYVALDNRYITQQKFQELHELTQEVTSLISGLQRYLKT